MGRREKPLDPAAGPVQRFAHALRKLRDEAGGPTYRDMAREVPYSAPTLSAAAAGERLPSLSVLLAYVTACGGDPHEWERRWAEALAEAADDRAPQDGDSPYPGLARFEADDRYAFHGRDELVAELIELTGRRRILAVIGASGSGKSSLLRAGLIPALRASGEGLDAIRILTPGDRPARTHRDLFVPRATDGNGSRNGNGSGESGEGGGRKGAGGREKTGDTLLVVDQFEEVFSLCHDPAERATFLDQLLAARDPDSRLRVILAVRADFYGRCAEHGPLAEALSDANLLVGPMQPDRLREAIVRPATIARLVVERALTARIVADVGGEPGGLPLMAHALHEVWRRRSGKTLTEAAYDAIGGVRGAVAHTAEEVHGTFTPAEVAATRALLLRMVSPGDGTSDTRRPVDRAELAADAATERVLERLVRARLLTVDGTVVDLAHEALIDGWPRLKGWIDEDRERLRLHRRLTESANAWAELARDPGALYRGTRLTAARESFTDPSCLSPLERDFLTASIESYERGARAATRTTRRLRTLTAALAALLCVAVVAGLSAWRQSGTNARQRDEAEARRIADVARELRTSDPRTAMRLSVAAWRIADLPETRAAVRAAAGRREQTAYTPPDGLSLNAPSWLSGDGRSLTTVSHDRVTQWDVRAEREVRSVKVPGISEGVTDVSGDGRWIAYHSEGGVTVRDLTSRTTRHLLVGDRRDDDGAFSPSGRLFVDKRHMGEDRARIQVWDVRRQKRVFTYGRAEDGGQMPVVSPDDRLVAWCIRPEARLEIHDLATGRRLAPNWPPAMGQRLCGSGGDEFDFTPDGRAVAVVNTDGVHTWDFRAGRERAALPLNGVGQTAVRFDSTGDYALTWSGGLFAVWRTDSPDRPLITFPVPNRTVSEYRLDIADAVLRYREGGRTNSVRTFSLDGLVGDMRWRQRALTHVVFDQDGRTVRSPGPARMTRTVARDGTLFTAVTTDSGVEVRRGGDRPRSWMVGTPQMSAVAIAPTGRTVLEVQGQLIDVSTGRRSKAVRGEDLVEAAAFSPDGRYLAVAVGNGRISLWDARGQRRIAVLVDTDDAMSPPVLAFSADGSLLAVGDEGGSVRVWETAAPRLSPALVQVGDGPLLAVGFTPDNRELRVATPHLPQRGYALAPESAATTVCARAGGGVSEEQWRAYLPAVSYRGTC
ncbi:hypothetical protein [Streptomyces sp. NPDC020747]|uniref:nSTAND1 domain-containing NTPase n=1 Tax=Streptomyces sp. NPDC020747 TaxID=3365086 RepID=UPI0037AC01D2